MLKTRDFARLAEVSMITLRYYNEISLLKHPVFGLATNGSEFRFLKLVQQEVPNYALSDLFTVQRRENDLYQILRILKRIGEQIKS